MAVHVCRVVHPIHDGRKRQPGDDDGVLRYDASLEPCPAVTADGIGATPRHRAWLEIDVEATGPAAMT